MSTWTGLGPGLAVLAFNSSRLFCLSGVPSAGYGSRWGGGSDVVTGAAQHCHWGTVVPQRSLKRFWESVEHLVLGECQPRGQAG